MAAVDGREAAAVTFVFTAAGVGFLGLGSAFWGLVAKLAMTLLGQGQWTEPVNSSGRTVAGYDTPADRGD